MTEAVTILGTAALPVGKWQTAPGTVPQVLEHEVLAMLVMEAMADAGVEKFDIGSMIFALPRPYTQQKYFATFMANYLRLPATSISTCRSGSRRSPGTPWTPRATSTSSSRHGRNWRRWR